MDVLFTDYKQPDLDLEYALLRQAGISAGDAQCRTPEEVIGAASGASVLVANSAPISREVFQALPQLRMISSVGIGVDHIDTRAARENGVWVANVPAANVEEVATHALAMSLSLIRHLPAYDRSVRMGTWDKRATGPLRRPSTLTYGIMGLGHIGQALVDLVRPCFGQILAYDPYCPSNAWPAGVEEVNTLEDLFCRSDVLSIHVPLTPETRGLVSASLLGRMSGGVLVNTSRGPIVDEAALLDALDNGTVGGAALDVLHREPPPRDCPLLQHPQIMLSPHAAFYSLEAEEALRRGAVDNVIRWLNEGRVEHPIVEGAPPIGVSSR